jgi:hypothetical protein
MGIIIMIGGTAIFSKTRIQRTTALSSTELETMAGCDSGNDIKYFRKLFIDLRFPLTGLTPMGHDNEGMILIVDHHQSSCRTHHMDLQFFATQERVWQGLIRFIKINGTANPVDALLKPLYPILHRHHFDRLMGYYGSQHVVLAEYRLNPNDNSPPGWLFGFFIFIWAFHLYIFHVVRSKISHSFCSNVDAHVFIGRVWWWDILVGSHLGSNDATAPPARAPCAHLLTIWSMRP